IPTLLLSVFPIKAQTWMYTVPLMGQQVAIMRLLRGDAVAPFHLWLCFACTTVAAILVYLVTALIYRSERLAISA
ncbi:MAG: ABC transporter permease, partial [Dokdonella sp.]